MAITTVAGLQSGLQPNYRQFKSASTTEAAGVLHSLFYTAGDPPAATAPSPGLNGAALTTYAGQIPYLNPASGNGYLAHWSGISSAAGSQFGHALLLDRLWHNSGFTVTTTTAQALSSVAWPARDRAASTNGDGVYIAIEVSTATTNVGAITNMTLDYTNSAGTPGRVGTIASFPATAVAGFFAFFQLDVGDIGVRSVQGLTLGTSLVTGTVHLVAARFLADLFVQSSAMPTIQDAFALGFPRFYDDTVPFVVMSSSATTNAGQNCSTIGYAHG